MSSILSDTKQALGLAADYTPFDTEITIFINAVIADVNQLGIGPSTGYAISSANNGWDELIGSEKRYNDVKAYVFLKVKMLFDPPKTGEVIAAFEKMIDEAAWRINIAREEIDNPPVVEEEEESEL